MTNVGCSGLTMYGPFDVRIVGVFPNFGSPGSLQAWLSPGTARRQFGHRSPARVCPLLPQYLAFLVLLASGSVALLGLRNPGVEGCTLCRRARRHVCRFWPWSARANLQDMIVSFLRDTHRATESISAPSFGHPRSCWQRSNSHFVAVNVVSG